MRHDVASILIIDLAGNFLGQKTHSVYLVCVLRYSRLHPQQLGQKTSKLPVQTTDIFRVEKSLRDSMTSEPSTSSHCPSNLPKVSKIVIAVLNVHIYIYTFISEVCVFVVRTLDLTKHVANQLMSSCNEHGCIYACLWIYHTSFQVTDLLPCISPTAKTQPQRIVEFYVLRWTALRLNHSQKQEELMFHKKQLLHQHWSCNQHSNNSHNFRLSRSITALSQATKSKWMFETI